MLFAYNTSFYSTTKCTPFFLTYGHEARYPSNPNPEIQHHYGDTLAVKWYSQLQEARKMATHHSVQASEKSKENFDSHTFPIKYSIGQLVWLNEFNFLGRNRKLSPNWSGPYPILKIFNDSVIELKLPRRFIRVNVSRVKPYVPPFSVEKRQTEMPKINLFIEPKSDKIVPTFVEKTVEKDIIHPCPIRNNVPILDTPPPPHNVHYPLSPKQKIIHDQISNAAANNSSTCPGENINTNKPPPLKCYFYPLYLCPHF